MAFRIASSGANLPIRRPLRKTVPAPRYPLLLPEDEAEVERMFQRLKSVGHFDQKTSPEDK